MTLAATSSYVGFTATASQTVFPLPFRVFAASDIEVYRNGNLTTGYTISGIGNSTSTLTMSTPMTAGDLIRVRRATARQQLIDYRTNDAFGAESHEAALDRLCAMVQDFLEELSRRPALALGIAAAYRNLSLPTPEAGKVIGWADPGPGLANYTPEVVTPPFPPAPTQYLNLVDDFGAVGDGIEDDSAAVQAAMLAAVAQQKTLYVPCAEVGYRIDTVINLTDLEGPLTVVGDGQYAPTFGAALVAPERGSIFLGNTGTGHAIFECLGSNNILFRDLTISTLGQNTPSQVGIVFGVSTTSPAAQTPGGANCSLENVSIWLTEEISSVPLYFAGGAGLSHYTNLWTLGDYGVVLTADNHLNYGPVYATVGTAIGVDGMHFAGCNLLGSGEQALVYIQDCHNMRFDQLYLATIRGGASYDGQPYAIFINEATDIKIDVELDYFPSLLSTQGSLRSVHIQGSTFPNETPLGENDPVIAFFGGTSLINCSFAVEAVMGAVENFWYTSDGDTATMTLFLNSDFLFDTSVSDNVFFGNATNDFGIPFFNLRFNGNSDTGVTISMLIEGVATVDAEKRYFLNGNKLGSA